MSLVKTNEKCIGCNRCIRACSCTGANIAVERDRVNVIEVDPKKCIACGACLHACEHDAREYVDDVEQFFADLKDLIEKYQGLEDGGRPRSISFVSAPIIESD